MSNVPLFFSNKICCRTHLRNVQRTQSVLSFAYGFLWRSGKQCGIKMCTENCVSRNKHTLDELQLVLLEDSIVHVMTGPLAAMIATEKRSCRDVSQSHESIVVGGMESSLAFAHTHLRCHHHSMIAVTRRVNEATAVLWQRGVFSAESCLLHIDRARRRVLL